MKRKEKKITYLVQFSQTDGKLDPAKIGAITKMLTKKELSLYYQLLSKKRQDEMVFVTSAITMSDSMKQQVQRQFANRDLVFLQDSDIIAGLHVRFRDFVYDATLKNYLEKISELAN